MAKANTIYQKNVTFQYLRKRQVIKSIIGFTFIEMIVVTVLLMTLILLAIPSFSSIIQIRQLKMHADTLYSSLQTARLEAIKRNKNIFISFSPGTQWCYGINANSACNCLQA